MSLLPDIDIVAEIRNRDAGCEPERLALKYSAMRASAFAFLRGTSHLFYARLASHPALPAAPAVMACGDLHLENFVATGQGPQGLFYSVNDFDECLLAPVWWDCLRGASSIYVARKKLGLDKAGAKVLVAEFVLEFARQLQAGLPDDVAPVTPRSAGRAALNKAMAARTEVVRGKLALRVDGTYALPASAHERRSVRACLAMVSLQRRGKVGLVVQDVARRVAGLASLGTRRFSVLALQGNSKPLLLDLKQARAPGGAALTGIAQPDWPCHAERVATIERLAEPALRRLPIAVGTPRNPMVLRKFWPREARLHLAELGSGKALQANVLRLASTAACLHLRCAGHFGAADLAALAAFGASGGWRAEVTLQAIAMARQNKQDWRSFRKAFDGGAFA